MKKGEKMSEELKEKLRVSLKGRSVWNKGTKGLQVAWNKGRPTPKEENRKMVEQRMKDGSYVAWNKGKPNPKWLAENNPNWAGGVSKNPEYYGFMSTRRKLRKIENGGSHTLGEWETLKAQYNWTCPCCKKSEPEIKLTEDHIVAISKGGSDNVENIQPLCLSCNSSKQAKTIRFPLGTTTSATATQASCTLSVTETP